MIMSLGHVWRVVFFAVLASLLPTSALASGTFVGDHGKRPKLVVFVHGLTGSGSGTWRTDDRQASWPWKMKAVREQRLFGDADVYVYDYASNIFGNGPTLASLTADMSKALRDEAQSGRYETVIFVAHSLGGVLTRQVLLGDDALRRKTAALYLFAVPQQGSHLATLATALGFASPVVRQLSSKRAGSSETYLDELNRTWIDRQADVAAYCAYETQPTPVSQKAIVGWMKFFVVLQRSAGALCNKAFVPLNADHNSIIEGDSGYDLLRSWHLDVVKKNFRMAGGEPNAPVMMASCATRHTSYELAFESAIQTQAADLGQAFRFSRQLPVNWRDDYKDLLWEGYPPEILVIHLSCFRNGPTAISLSDHKERKADLVALLTTLQVDQNIQVLVYSRAFREYPKYLDDEPIVGIYRAQGRLRTFAVDFTAPFSSSKKQKAAFRSILQEMLRSSSEVKQANTQ